MQRIKAQLYNIHEGWCAVANYFVNISIRYRHKISETSIIVIKTTQYSLASLFGKLEDILNSFVSIFIGYRILDMQNIYT